MQTHEKWMAVVIAAAVVGALAAPRWWPDTQASARPKRVATAPVDDTPRPAARMPLPPFDPGAFASRLDTAHYAIASNATPAQTQRTGEVLEALHAAYAGFFAGQLPAIAPGTRHQVALYRDRPDFQKHNTSRAWAEGFYRKPVCHAYFDANAANPMHWMLHEGTHQLDTEWADFPRTPWVEEGLASYFGTSRMEDGVLLPGSPDPDTYPLWWLGDMGLSGDVERDIAARRIVPLRELIENDGPPVPADVNRYYVGYWSLAHYLLHGENGRHAAAFRAMVASGGSLERFEERVGPVETVQAHWYAHLLAQREALAGAMASSR